MVIQNNKMDDAVNTLDIVAKKAGANAKQQKDRVRQTDIGLMTNVGGKKIIGLSKKEH
jgi:hypothetical protein